MGLNEGAPDRFSQVDISNRIGDSYSERDAERGRRAHGTRRVKSVAFDDLRERSTKVVLELCSISVHGVPQSSRVAVGTM